MMARHIYYVFDECVDFCQWMYEEHCKIELREGNEPPSYEEYLEDKFFWLADMFKEKKLH